MSAMKHLAEDILEMINEENKEVLQALNEVKEHNKLLIQENHELKQLISEINKSILFNKLPVYLFLKMQEIHKEVNRGKDTIKIQLSSMYGKFGSRD